jgi:phosphodiesterase/alkaline phosphatase D-like protein
MIRSLILGAAVTALLAGPAGAEYVQLPAGAPFDGRWSVNISTTSGDCHSDGVIVFQIANGQIVSDSAGDVRVKLVNAQGSALGSGRLGARDGSGTWSASYVCSGTWQASRF